LDDSAPAKPGETVASVALEEDVMQALRVVLVVAGVLLCGKGALLGAEDYPLSLTMDASANSGTATVTAQVTIRVERLMADAARTRVSDELKHGGYTNFLRALRPLPVVGAVETSGRKVDLRYAHEQRDESGRRLVLVADQPLFFLNADPGKIRAGYELTIVELRFDGKGSASGTMAGAARVKPAPDGSVVLDDFAVAPVKLAQRGSRP
jgi:hypothetical protein